MIQKLKNSYHLFQAKIANLYFRYPSKKLKIIGITGTDGKTTTTHLIYHILKAAHKKVSMVSSVYGKIADTIYETGFHVTTPSVFPLQKFLKKSQDVGDEYFVLETTSHALDQNRVAGIKFFMGVLTNITHEHLDYHKTYENYLKTKAKLLLSSSLVLINRDDQSFLLLSSILGKKEKKFYTYGLKHMAYFNIDISGKIRIPMAEFNKYNYLAAYGACQLLGVEEKIILESLKTFQLPPGRLEVVSDKNYYAIVDFAHTPNAIDQVLRAIEMRFSTGEERLIHVFGSAAKRDQSKRPLMGEASGGFSDIVILTEEDHRTEDPAHIAEEIATGLKKMKFTYVPPDKLKNAKRGVYTIITDRSKALRMAIHIAQKGDVVVATGKGHEKSICRGKIEYPWNEKEEILKAIKERL